MGLAQSLSSRYTFFSVLFVIFAWIAFVEEFLQYRKKPLLNNGAYLCAVVAAIVFSLSMDAIGLMVKSKWDSRIVQGMVVFEHPNPPDSTKGPVIPLWDGDYARETLNPGARAALMESIRLGVYQPPKL